eukprot:4183372-Pyramimonas_sp.AAC.1
MATRPEAQATKFKESPSHKLPAFQGMCCTQSVYGLITDDTEIQRKASAAPSMWRGVVHGEQDPGPREG